MLPAVHVVPREMGHPLPPQMRHFLAAAEDGDARAQYSVGFMYYQGRGTDPAPDRKKTDVTYVIGIGLVL